MTTYEEALAACVDRWGEPAATYRADDPEPYALDRWNVGAASVWFCCGTPKRVTITAGLPYATGCPMQQWATTAPDATPLPDAIDAAVRWMAEHNDPTKGP